MSLEYQVFYIYSFDEVEGVLGKPDGLSFAGKNVPAVFHHPNLNVQVDRRFDILLPNYGLNLEDRVNFANYFGSNIL
jgi:hypothetical protein